MSGNTRSENDATAVIISRIGHDCDHSDCISKSALPTLPDGWCGPWEVSGRYVVGRFQGEELGFALCEIGGAQFLAALLNITHPGLAKEGE